MKLSTLAELVNGKLKGGDKEFVSFSFHIPEQSKIIPNSLMIIGGKNFNEEKLTQAIASGVVAVLTSRRKLNADISQIVVKNLGCAIAKIALLVRNSYHGLIIGICGSSGKTTTSYLLKHLLAAKYKHLDATENICDAVWGMSLELIYKCALANTTPIILEMATLGSDQLPTMIQIAQPQIFIITSILSGYSKELPTTEDFNKEIYAAIPKLPEKCVLIVNNDDSSIDEITHLAGERRVLTFSLHSAADVQAINVICLDDKIKFDLKISNHSMPMELNFIGEHNIYNALAACTVAYILKIPLTEMQNYLKLAPPLARHLQIFQGINNAKIINDSVSMNFPGILSAIKTLSRSSGKKILVLGNLYHFQDKQEYYCRVGEAAKKAGINYLMTLGKHTLPAAQAFGKEGLFFTHKKSLVKALKNHMSADTTLLIKSDKNSFKSILQDLIKY